MLKKIIKNREGKKVVILIEESLKPIGLALVMHGLGGWKEQAHIETFASAFRKANYTVVRFDTTNSFGESDGEYENATTTNYFEDLEDVIFWARNRGWYQEPFILAGHSLGGICTALYAQNNPEKIKGLAPISTVVSGELSLETYSKKGLKDWKETGWQERESSSRPGLIKKLKWKHMEDRLKYSLLPKADKLTMPVLIIVGDQDDRTPPAHQKILYKALPGPKEMHIISGAEHTFREKKHLDEIKGILLAWIKKL